MNEIGPALYPTKIGLGQTTEGAETVDHSVYGSQTTKGTVFREPTTTPLPPEVAPTRRDFAPTFLPGGPPGVPDCVKWPCLNGGSCFYSEKGPKVRLKSIL